MSTKSKKTLIVPMEYLQIVQNLMEQQVDEHGTQKTDRGGWLGSEHGSEIQLEEDYWVILILQT